MATIEDFILRFKTVGEGAIKSTSASINNLKADVESFGQVGGPLQNTLSGIVTKLGPVGIAAAAAGAAISALGGTALRLAGEVMDISGATGIAAGTVNSFAGSLIMAGGKAEDAALLLGKLNGSIQEAAAGSEPLQKAFRDLGIFVTDTNGKVRSTEDILIEVTNKFQSGALSAKEYTAVVDILGKTVKQLELEKLKVINDPRYTEAAQQLDKLNDSMDLVSKQIKTQLVIAFGDFAKIVNEGGISSGLAKITESLGTLVGDILNLPTDAIAGVLNLFGANIKDPVGLGSGVHALVERAKKNREQYQAEQVKFKAAQDAAAKAEAAALAKANVKDKPTEGGYGARPESGVQAAKQSAERIAELEQDIKRQSQLKSNSERLEALLVFADKESAITVKLASDIAAININLAADTAKERLRIFANEKLTQLEKEKEFAAKSTEITAKAASDEANLRQRATEQALREAERLAEERKKEKERIEEIIRVSKARVTEEQELNVQLEKRNKLLNENLGSTDREQQNAEKLLEIEEKREEQLRRIRLIKDLPAADRAAREQEINDIFEERLGITQKQQEQDVKNQESFSKGFEKAFRTYAESAKNNFETAGRVFGKITQGMEDSIVDFAKTGKFEFKNFLNVILEELLRSQVRQLIAQLFSSSMGGGGAGGGGLFGGKIIPGFLAEGGPATANKPYIVGERGPELFVPGTSGTVIPNNQLNGAGISNTFVTYNINAVDAPSFKSMIARDPSFIHAIAMKGAASIPGRR